MKTALFLALVLLLSGCTGDPVSEASATTNLFMGIFASGGIAWIFADDCAERREQRKAIKAGVGYWTVDEKGMTEFHYGVKP